MGKDILKLESFYFHIFLSDANGERWSRGERLTANRGDSGLIPPAAVSKLRQFRSPHICLCLSEETLKTDGPFYLVSMPGEVKDPKGGKCVTCSGLTNCRRQL